MVYRLFLWSHLIFSEDVIENCSLPLGFLIVLEFLFDFNDLVVQYLLAVSINQGADRMDNLLFSLQEGRQILGKEP